MIGDEQLALEAAHADRAAGKRTLVIAQTSNDHLHELNAHAQAIRYQHGELGHTVLPVPGKPYGLRENDEVQIRRSLGTLRNGMAGQVRRVSESEAVLQLDERLISLNSGQLEQTDVRLAYVQHPFPAQGHTTDTAHLIVGDHATQEGSYVAFTRARERTTIYSQLHQDELAEHIGRSEPEMPSITMPLEHETTVLEQTPGQRIVEQLLEPGGRQRTIETRESVGESDR